MIKLYKIIGLIFFITNLSCLGMDFNTTTVKTLINPATKDSDINTLKTQYTNKSFWRAVDFVRARESYIPGTTVNLMQMVIKTGMLKDEDRKFVNALVMSDWTPIRPKKLVKDMINEVINPTPATPIPPSSTNPTEKKSPQNSSLIDSFIKRVSGGYLTKGCSFIASFLKQQGYERMSDFFYSNIPIRVAFASIIVGISAGAYALYKNKKANIDIPENNTAQDSNDDQIDDEA